MSITVISPAHAQEPKPIQFPCVVKLLLEVDGESRPYWETVANQKEYDNLNKSFKILRVGKL